MSATARPPALPVGARLGDFVIERVIRAGANPNPRASEMYVARAADGTRAWVKQAWTPTHADDLRRTAEVHAAITSPHVPRLLACGDDWIALEYIDGALVLRLVAEVASGVVSLEPEDALLVGIDVLAALQVAHRAGVVHGDAAVREHWIVDRHGRASLLHFRWGNHDRGPQWPAPEQAVGTTDHRSDLYSVALGIAATYGVIARARSVAVMSFDEVVRSFPIGAPVALPPEPVARVLARATEPRKADRYQSASELHIALTAAIAASGLTPSRERLAAAVNAVPDTATTTTSSPVLDRVSPVAGRITVPLDRYRLCPKERTCP